MNNKPKIITAQQFATLCAQKDSFGLDTNILVQGHVRLNGEIIKLPVSQFATDKEIQTLHFCGINFTNRVTVEHFDHFLMHVDTCNFMEGLSINDCTGYGVYLSNCTTRDIAGFSNKFDHLVLNSITKADQSEYAENPTIDLSGFELKEKLCIENVSAGEMLIVSRNDRKKLITPLAKIDDPLWALQFKLLGIPVAVSTEVARQMLSQGSYSARICA